MVLELLVQPWHSELFQLGWVFTEIFPSIKITDFSLCFLALLRPLLCARLLFELHHLKVPKVIHYKTAFFGVPPPPLSQFFYVCVNPLAYLVKNERSPKSTGFRASFFRKVFDPWTITRSELFSYLICVHTVTFTLRSIFSQVEAISLKI